jgi:nitrite reductase/ring-hydroxylating ferredoxin subunit
VANDDSMPIDARIDSPGREGLTGTAPANVYRPLRDPEQVTRAPDSRPMLGQPAWRTDFPIDWPQDAYIERRDFMKFMVLTSAAFVVGQFWIAGQNSWRRRRGELEMVRITSLDGIAIGAARTFTYPTEHDPCILVRPADNVLFAYSQKCTHLSCAVIPRVDEGIIRCPCHEGVFDLASGRPIAGPPRRPLTRILLRMQGDDVYAVGVEERTT